MEKGKVHVLLLSMSTFNKELTESYYQVQKLETGKEAYSFCGVSQLEAGTKYFMRKLQENSIKFDKILIVESAAVRDRERARNVSEWLSNPSDASKSMTAVEFYKARIMEYVAGAEQFHSTGESTEKLREAIQGYEDQVAEKPLNQLYQDGDALFEDIEIEENVAFDGINQLRSKIRSLKGKDMAVKLYLDMQGARRYETFIINAAVKMLEAQDVKVEASVALDFSPRNNESGKFNSIVDTTINDRIFEMVSGMNEFLKTGRGDTLYEFWDNSRELLNMRDDSPEKSIISEIKEISNAISICDMVQFDKSLISFKKAIDTYNKPENKNKRNPLFESFVNDLRADYNKYHLLEAEKTNVLDQLIWCKEKKLYQQALTLLEAKVPDDLVDSGILYYRNNEDKDMLGQLLDRLNEKGALNMVPKYMFVDGKKRDKIKPEKINFVWIKYVFCKEPEFRKRSNNKQSDAPKQGKKSKEDIIQNIVNLLVLYYDMAKIRNSLNHALGEYSYEDVEEKLGKFISKYDEIKKDDEIHLDYYSEVIKLKQMEKRKGSTAWKKKSF